MSFSVSPDYFLLFILLGGFLVILFTGLVYAVQSTWRLKKLRHKNRQFISRPQIFDPRQLPPPYIGQSGSPRPIGTGFYTSPSFPGVCVPCGQMEMGLDQVLVRPEWINTAGAWNLNYSYGLDETDTTQGSNGDEDDVHTENLFYTTPHPGQSLNVILVPWTTSNDLHSSDSGQYGHYSEGSSDVDVTDIDFSDGGAADAAAF